MLRYGISISKSMRESKIKKFARDDSGARVPFKPEQVVEFLEKVVNSLSTLPDVKIYAIGYIKQPQYRGWTKVSIGKNTKYPSWRRETRPKDFINFIKTYFLEHRLENVGEILRYEIMEPRGLIPATPQEVIDARNFLNEFADDIEDEDEIDEAERIVREWREHIRQLRAPYKSKKAVLPGITVPKILLQLKVKYSAPVSLEAIGGIPMQLWETKSSVVSNIFFNIHTFLAHAHETK